MFNMADENKDNENKDVEDNTGKNDENLSKENTAKEKRKVKRQQKKLEKQRKKQEKKDKREEKSGEKKLLYDRVYRKLLIIPALILLLSFIYISSFYAKTGDFIDKDVSLTGGTTIIVFDKTDISSLREHLQAKNFGVVVRGISDLRTGEQKAFMVETTSSEQEIKDVLEDYLGYELGEDNSTIEFTGPSLSKSFFKQLILAIIFAFTFMGVVVFFIFGKNMKIKILLIIFALITPFLFFVLNSISIDVAFIISAVVLIICIIFYLIYSMPSFMVVLSAFADITMSIALVNLLGMKLSSAGVVAFLMLIGYSVDTDIMLTSRALKRKEGTINSRLKNSFKTGITMTLTSMVAVFVALILTTFSPILKQIFTILLIGLGFDIINTWITNSSLLKWYLEKKEK